jgi:hypothetical protein
MLICRYFQSGMCRVKPRTDTVSLLPRVENPSLLPGPRRVGLQFYGKNSAKFKKIQHFCHYFFLPVQSKNLMLKVKTFLKICCDKLTLRSKNTPQKPVFHIKTFFGRFSASFLQKWRPYGRKFSSANIYFYGRFQVIWQNFRPAGNSETHPCRPPTCNFALYKSACTISNLSPNQSWRIFQSLVPALDTRPFIPFYSLHSFIQLTPLSTFIRPH